MAIKPVVIVEWATANPQDPASLQNAIIEPTAGKKASGYLRLEIPPRQDFNWILNLIGLWMKYLEDTTDDNLSGISTNTTDIGTNAFNIVGATAAAGAAQDDIDDHIADVSGAHNDTAITNTSGVAGANVKLALDQLDTDISDHIADVTAAHQAFAINNTSGVTGTTVQAALNTLNTDIGGNNTLITGHISDTAGAHNDSAIANTSSVVGANVQLALNALLAAIKPSIQVNKAPGSLNFPNPTGTPGSTASDTFTVTGAVVGDSVLVTALNRDTLINNSRWGVYEGIVTAANTVKIMASNSNSTIGIAALDLELVNYLVTVFPA